MTLWGIEFDIAMDFLKEAGCALLFTVVVGTLLGLIAVHWLF